MKKRTPKLRPYVFYRHLILGILGTLGIYHGVIRL